MPGTACRQGQQGKAFSKGYYMADRQYGQHKQHHGSALHYAKHACTKGLLHTHLRMQVACTACRAVDAQQRARGLVVLAQ